MGKSTTQRQPVSAFQDADQELENLIGYNLKRTYVHVQNDFRETLGAEGLAPRVFSALALVVQFPNITQSELARMLGIERSGLVAMIDDLEKRNYLGRVAVAGDRRRQALVPTKDGVTAYAESLAAVKAHERRIFAMLTETEQAQLLGLLKKFRDSIDGKD